MLKNQTKAGTAGVRLIPQEPGSCPLTTVTPVVTTLSSPYAAQNNPNQPQSLQLSLRLVCLSRKLRSCACLEVGKMAFSPFEFCIRRQSF